MLRRDFLLGGIAGVAGAVAAGACYIAKGHGRWREARGSIKHSEYEGPYSRLAELAQSTAYDVCVVGSGPAGTFLANELADRGVRTVILEAGVPPSEMAKNPRYGDLNGLCKSGSTDYPTTATHLMAPGGTSALWNGRCPRLSVTDFEPNAYTPPGSPWPIRYADLEPYYGHAEKSLCVEGDPQGANHCPRSAALKAPRDALPADAPIRQLIEQLGMRSSELILPPSSVSPNAPGPIRVARDVLAGVAKKHAVTLVLGATAHRFIEDASGRVTAVRARDVDGSERLIRARAFVIAGGGIETARRLLLSRSERWPDGLGNRHGRVGLSFTEHSVLHFSGLLNLPRRSDEAAYRRARTFEFYDAFRKQGLGSLMLHMGIRPESDDAASPRHLLELIGEMELESLDTNRIALSADPKAVDAFGDPFPELTFSFGARDLALHEKVRQLVAGIYARAGASRVAEAPVKGWGPHHMGTVRMGANPRTSVVDANLRVHDLKNLFAVTSGVYVTGGGVNPTLTIVALSHRLADHLTGLLSSGGLPPLPA